MHEGLIPEPSLGTHFFNDLVEMDMLYIALYPDKEDCIFNRKLLSESENRLSRLLPDAASWSSAVKVLESASGGPRQRILLNVNVLDQKGICYLG